ncbi:MAG: aminomethyl-transferring glycine dehydrogenase, partial [Verrucomicrobiales bacterium]|nr:aminomethyl-transferring glycine dehydrogenase [Verrucomicrobiales bacterium]
MHTDDFSRRHLGIFGPAADSLAREIGHQTVDDLVNAAVPAAIRGATLDLPPPATEQGALHELRSMMGKNRIMKSFIGQGYYGTVTPPVIQRNILENPGWYTAYTPYQAEIAQGRMEALMNFQTMVTELTALPVANASLLDEGTAAAEAVSVALSGAKAKAEQVLVDAQCFPQTISVIKTRMDALGIRVLVGDAATAEVHPATDGTFAVVVQYPAGDGSVQDWRERITHFQSRGVLVIMACDLLSLTLLRPPGELGADIAVGSAQRFGVPMGFGGPHAGFMAVKDELKRRLPGRIVGLSVDAHGKPAYRLSLQTREQHIRREKATSNICTAQVLLAVMAGMYAAWHGPDGLREIALKIHRHANFLAVNLLAAGISVHNETRFDTLTIHVPEKAELVALRAEGRGINVRVVDADTLAVSVDETTTQRDLEDLLEAFGTAPRMTAKSSAIPPDLTRQSPFLRQAVFNSFHAEHEMLRYLHRLETRDLALNESMISLGSCTMKLNATAEMMPLSWPEVSALHPFAPHSQVVGYLEMISQLENWLSKITGFAACSLQPNAGSQGEYAGLLAIRAWHHSRGETGRNVCLIPTSAHGTNPASAVMAGMKVVAVACDSSGNIDVADLEKKATDHAGNLAALMITYPSTHGVFEESIKDICRVIHEKGGQVYMDGANMNAQVGLTSPGIIGADVCHLNLHKTFCIPHGGGGPGVGPICVARHLAPFLPVTSPEDSGPLISAAPYGSASILTISWMYIRMMGAAGLTEATKIAILNANYVAHRLDPYFPVLYRGRTGLVAHECIIDLRKCKDSVGISVEDVAKRLMDYGYHSPTMSWPVPGTLMIEPTESETKAELDRFCDALISIHGEITAIEN